MHVLIVLSTLSFEGPPCDDDYDDECVDNASIDGMVEVYTVQGI